MIYKLFWLFVSMLRGIFFKRFGFPSLIASPLMLSKKKNISIGKRVRIMANARLETIANGKIIIEDNVSIGPNVNITAANIVHIYSDVTISANVFITDMDHDTKKSEKSVMDLPNKVSSGTTICERAFIGAGAVILAGSKISSDTVIGANSVVRLITEDSSIYAGNPVKMIRKK